MEEPIRLLVVDDRAIVREGIRALAAAHAGIAVVGETAEAAEAAHLYRTRGANAVVIDLQLYGGPGDDVLRALLRNDPDARVVVFTEQSAGEQVFHALTSGARGYVLKCDDPAQLIAAIRAVHAGRRYLTVEAAERLAAHVPATTLTCREKQVLELMADGETNRAIAARLGLCDETVKGHIRNILAKLGARSRTEAVSKALRRGLVRLAPLD